MGYRGAQKSRPGIDRVVPYEGDLEGRKAGVPRLAAPTAAATACREAAVANAIHNKKKSCKIILFSVGSSWMKLYRLRSGLKGSGTSGRAPIARMDRNTLWQS